MADASCSNCRFWRAGDEKKDDELRHCRRNPPAVNPVQAAAVALNLRDAFHDTTPFAYDEEVGDPYQFVGGGYGGTWQIDLMGVWPQTFGDAWCGGWESKESGEGEA